MLHLEKTTLGHFGALEMMRIIDLRGVHAVLPDALDDKQLLLVSDQFRDLLAGVDPDEELDSVRAALPLTLLLLAKAGAKQTGGYVEVEMEILGEALSLLCVAFDREIVNRMLKRRDRTIAGPQLMQSLERLVQRTTQQ